MEYKCINDQFRIWSFQWTDLNNSFTNLTDPVHKFNSLIRFVCKHVTAQWRRRLLGNYLTFLTQIILEFFFELDVLWKPETIFFQLLFLLLYCFFYKVFGTTLVKKRRNFCNLWVNSAFKSPEYSTRPHVGYNMSVCVCVGLWLMSVVMFS